MTAAALIQPSAASAFPSARPATVLPPAAQAIAALEPGGCRWPVGELDEPTFRFCNMPCRRRPYCEAHRPLANRRAAR